MQDMLAHLEKLRVQVAECEMIRDLATDPAKRQWPLKCSELSTNDRVAPPSR